MPDARGEGREGEIDIRSQSALSSFLSSLRLFALAARSSAAEKRETKTAQKKNGKGMRRERESRDHFGPKGMQAGKKRESNEGVNKI